MAEVDTNIPVPLWRRLIIGRDPLVTLARACVIAAVALFVFGVILRPYRVEGISMHPTYRDRSVNLLNRWAYLFHEPRRGDVVGIMTTGPRNMYLKRIVGLPGESIEIRRGRVFINGSALDEPYVKERANWHLPEKVLGTDEYVVIGDNRGMDQRLHSWGIIRREKIAGKVLW
jgi:signal peptidase I